MCGGEGGAGQPGLGGAGRQVGVRGLQVRELPPPANQSIELQMMVREDLQSHGEGHYSP